MHAFYSGGLSETHRLPAPRASGGTGVSIGVDDESRDVFDYRRTATLGAGAPRLGRALYSFGMATYANPHRCTSIMEGVRALQREDGVDLKGPEVRVNLERRMTHSWQMLHSPKGILPM